MIPRPVKTTGKKDDKPVEKIYRNVFFTGKIPRMMNGFITVKYTGHMYSDCKNMKDFSKKFDRNRDLLVSCNDCASRMYKNFIRSS